MEARNIKSSAFSLEKKGLLRSARNNELLRELLYGIFFFSFLALAFLSLNLIIQEHQTESIQLEEVKSAFQNYHHNLKEQPFEHIKAIVHTATCPTGYKDIPIGYFNGTNSGCICKDGRVLKKSQCSSQSSDHCVYKTALGPKSFSVWKSMKFCGKHYDQMKFVNVGTSCSSLGMTECQKGLCIKGGNCPVTSMTIKKKAPTNFDQISFFQDSMPFGVGNDLYLSRSVDSQPIVGMESKISSIPCLATSIKNPQSKSNKFYPLDKIPTNGCGKFLNTEGISTWFGKNDQKTFYKENNFEQRLTHMAFPEKFSDKTDFMTLYSTSRFDSKSTQECQQVPIASLDKISHFHSETFEIFNNFGICILVFSAIGLLLTCFFLCFNLKSFGNSKIHILVLVAILLICLVLSIALYIYMHHHPHTGEVKQVGEYFEKFIKEKCVKSDSLNRAAENVVKGYSGSYKTISWNGSAIFWISLISFVIVLGVFVARKALKNHPIPDPSI